MLEYLSADIICSEKRTVFRERSSRKTVSFKEQIMPKYKYLSLVYTTQVNSTFRARWLASWEVISQVLFTSEQPKENKMAFVAIFSQIKLLFGLLVIQLVWYILRGSVNIHHYSPPLRWIIVKYFLPKWRLSCLLSFKSFSQRTHFWKLGNI